MTKIHLPQKKNLKDNIFAKYFLLFSAIMLIVLTVLGTTLTALVGAYTQKQTTDLLMENAQSIANSVSSNLLVADMNDTYSNEKEMICRAIKIVSNSVDADIFVCDTEGNIILCKERADSLPFFGKLGKCSFHTDYNISDSILQQVYESSYVGSGVISGQRSFIAGGVAAIELTFTVPHEDKLIEAMRAKYSSGEIIIGAGTVMDAATARIAILAGAEYIVSPYFDPETVKTCNRYGIPSMPGIYTPTEAVHAMECGADVLKVFPGDIATPSFIKDIHGPIPNAVMMPSGGVDVDNVKDWIKAGAVAVGAGSSLIKGAKTGDYDLITETGKLFVERIKEARAEMKK